ncbi:hypothetical protein M569_03138, partial [Genlisea aurea]
FFFFFFFFFFFSTSESADPVASFCNGSNRTAQQSANIDALLGDIAAGTIAGGFTATSRGTGADKIYGLGQCRGDVDSSTCWSCINDAISSVSRFCPDKVDSKTWYDFCFLRYSPTNFFDSVDTSGVYLINVENVTTDPTIFNQKLGSLMREISSQAVKPPNRGLGKKISDISTYVRLYGLVQCTRDLSPLNCAQCLSTAVSNFPAVCPNRRGCRVLYSSCYVRYELYPFFFPL